MTDGGWEVSDLWRATALCQLEKFGGSTNGVLGETLGAEQHRHHDEMRSAEDEKEKKAKGGESSTISTIVRPLNGCLGLPRHGMDV